MQVSKNSLAIIAIASILIVAGSIITVFAIDRSFAPTPICDPSTHPNQFPKLVYLNSTHITSGNFVIRTPKFTTCELFAIGVLIDFSNHTVSNFQIIYVRANYTSILNETTSQVVSQLDISTLTDTSAVLEIVLPANTQVAIYNRGTMPNNYIVITDILELSHG